MPKYHINDEGEVKECSRYGVNCSYPKNRHFNDKILAETVAQLLIEERAKVASGHVRDRGVVSEADCKELIKTIRHEEDIKREAWMSGWRHAQADINNDRSSLEQHCVTPKKREGPACC